MVDNHKVSIFQCLTSFLLVFFMLLSKCKFVWRKEDVIETLAEVGCMWYIADSDYVTVVQVFQSVVSQAKPLLYISIQYYVSSTFEYTTF